MQVVIERCLCLLRRTRSQSTKAEWEFLQNERASCEPTYPWESRRLSLTLGKVGDLLVNLLTLGKIGDLLRKGERTPSLCGLDSYKLLKPAAR